MKKYIITYDEIWWTSDFYMRPKNQYFITKSITLSFEDSDKLSDQSIFDKIEKQRPRWVKNESGDNYVVRNMILLTEPPNDEVKQPQSGNSQKAHTISNGLYFESDNPIRRNNELSDLFFDESNGGHFWSTFPPSIKRKYCAAGFVF